MSAQPTLWEQMSTAQNALVMEFQASVQAAVQESIFNGIDGWWNIGLPYYLKPDSVTPEHFGVRNPYTNPQNFIDSIQALAEANLLDEQGVITEAAYQAYKGLISKQDAAISAIETLPEANLQQISDYLLRCIEGAKKYRGIETPAFTNATRRTMNNDMPHIIFYTIARLNAFRDDCHLTAWRHLDVDGKTWETFTQVWAGDANSAEALAENLGFRGYTADDYQAALDELSKKGWVTADEAGAYTLTEAGQTLRNEVEAQTDTYFYAAFDLSDDDKTDLSRLLKAFEAKHTPEPEAN